MSVWRDNASLSCWAGLSPANNANGGKKKNTKVGNGGHYLKLLLVQCALAAVKSTKKDPYFHYKYETLKKRRGHKKAIIAIARKMLVAIYHMVRDDADFLPVDHEDIIQNAKKTKGLNLNNVIAFLKEQGADESTIHLVKTQCSGKETETADACNKSPIVQDTKKAIHLRKCRCIPTNTGICKWKSGTYIRFPTRWCPKSSSKRSCGGNCYSLKRIAVVYFTIPYPV